MIELLQITADPILARRCDALEGMRLFVDLEQLGKAERQAGRNTFISAHQLEDVGRIKVVLRRSRLMVRVNPLNAATGSEVEAVLAQGADLLMLPMFRNALELREFARIVAGRAGIVPLVETAEAVDSLVDWVDTPGVVELYVGLNDLHLSLGCRFMFEPLATGLVDRVAQMAHQRGLRFGFGGIARMDQGELPGRDVLGEHVRLGSGSVILSRTFQQPSGLPFEEEVVLLRDAEKQLQARTPAQVEADRLRVKTIVGRIAAAATAA